MIRFDDVRFRYRAQSPWALDGVSFTVSGGEVVALLGANGSGKSTAVRLTNGLLVPYSGSVTVDGSSTREVSTLHQLRETVGIVFQRPDDQIVATSVEDDVAFGPENLRLAREVIRDRVDRSLETVGLTGLERREPHLLSGGQKQRLAIAGALAMEPRYLVLDEPTSMLDPHGRADVLGLLERLRSDGRGILLVTHDLGIIAGADRAVVLSGGVVVFDGPVAALLFGDLDLAAWGLALPPVVSLSRALADLGAPVIPTATTPAEVVGALCR